MEGWRQELVRWVDCSNGRFYRTVERIEVEFHIKAGVSHGNNA